MKLPTIFKLSLISTAIALTGCGGGSDDSPAEEKVNNTPTVTAQSTTVNENTQVTVNATASDSDGTISSYNWQLTSGQAVTLTGVDTQSVSFTAPSVLEAGDTLSFTVTVTDDKGATASTTNTVTVNNVTPSASVADQTVNEKANVSISAAVNGNGDDIASYLWTQTSGTPVIFTGSDTENLTFTAPEIRANEVIGLSLTVTDADNDSVTVESLVNVNQLTIPLTIAGLATDSPITNGEISVNVAGRDITVDVTADENGVYSVDLLLDDSEANAFISIIAQGVAEQVNAGLITLLGTAGQLSTLAGDDNILTEDENFSVNVTNITTAQYALAKLANNGADITNDEELAALTQALNYDEVLTLATAIKVAIDKAAENPELALPDSISNTLDLVNNIEATQNYVQEVIDEPEYQEAQEEMFADENLVDTNSVWAVPEAYHFLPQGSLYSGFTIRFTEGEGGTGHGTNGGNDFTWEKVNGVINAIVTDGEVSRWIDYREINGEFIDVETENSTVNYQLKRLNSSDKSDVILLTTTSLTHYPNGEFIDETSTYSATYVAVKNNKTVDITHAGAGVAYLPFNDDEPDNSNIVALRADEFVLNANGTGHATINDFDFTWQVIDGVFELYPPGDSADDVYVAKWKQLTTGLAANQFAHEFVDNDGINASDDFVSTGAIVTSPLNWEPTMVAGIYTYDNASFADPLENFWFELSENGNAETYSSGDWNKDGVLTDDEIGVMYGSWSINNDGSLVITRVRTENGDFTSDCRNAETEGCVVYHERTWRLIGQKGGTYALFHKHDFKNSNLGWGSDQQHYDNRTVFKVDTPPVAHANRQAKKTSNTNHDKQKISIANRFSTLEPELNKL